MYIDLWSWFKNEINCSLHICIGDRFEIIGFSVIGRTVGKD